MNTYNNSGLKFIDFSSLNKTFKINWIKRYLKNSTSIRDFISHHVFSHSGGLKLISLCNHSIPKIPLKLSSFHHQVLLVWALIYKLIFSPQRYYIRNNCNIIYKSKSFYEKWFNNGIILVSQLFKEDGLLCNYSELLTRYNVPVTPKELSVVFDVIPSGLSVLFRNVDSSVPLSVSPPDATQSPLGKVCFSFNGDMNPKIRAPFLRTIWVPLLQQQYIGVIF